MPRVHRCPGAGETETGGGPLGTGVTGSVSHLAWMPGTELWSSTRAANTLNHQAISPTLIVHNIWIRFPLDLGWLFSCFLVNLAYYGKYSISKNS